MAEEDNFPRKDINREKAMMAFARDLAAFGDLSLKDHEKQLDESVEDLMIRLEEFEQLLDMNKSDINTCLFKEVPELSKKYKDIQRVFDKIDKLEYLVAKVKSDMDKLEAKLSDAELTVEGNALSSLMPMIFGSKPTTANNESQELPKIFSTNEFFPPVEDK